MVGMGCPDHKKNKLAYFDVFSPHVPKKKINSHDTIRSVVRDLTYRIFLPAKVDIRGLISGAQKAVIFVKKVGFFLIL